MALGKYEVVVLFDAANSQDKIDAAKKAVEELIGKFGGKVIEKDDIGHLETLYEIGSSNNPYFYSLYTELEGETIKEFKRQLGILPAVVRYKVFKMKPNQKFLKLKDIEKEIEAIDFTGLTKSGIFNEINQGTQSNEEKK
jgi:ribosomal protein S6